jgi:hypothetical protein
VRPKPPGGLLRAVGAALVLVVLLIGVPLALGVIVGWPLPRSIPTIDALRAALAQQLPWESVVNAIVCLAWLAWAQLVVCVAVEARAALTEPGRGRLTAPRIPLAGLNQALARNLIAAVLVVTTSSGSWTTPAAASAGLTPAAAAAGVRATEPARVPATVDPVAPSPAAMPGDVPTVDGTTAGTVAALKPYVVRPPEGASFDCLWNIAERHLGDGLRYDEIFALNRGRTQPDGTTLRDEDLIRPGWILLLPADAVGLADARFVPAPPPAAPPPVVVTELAPPPVPAPVPAPPVPPARAPETTGPTAIPSPTQAPSGAVGEQPSVYGPSGIGGIGDLVDIRASLAGGGLLAAGLLLALARLRRRQQRSRRTGRRIRLPGPDLAPVEVALRVAAEPDDLAFLDRGLRTLGLMLDSWDRPLPSVVGARLTEERLELLLAASVPDVPTPFVAAEDDRVWALTRDAALPDGETMSGLLCPLPALVPIGRDDRGLILLDLEAVGVTSLVGAAEDIAPVMAWIVTELALASWPDYLHVTLVGFGDRLASIDPERVDVVGALDETRVRAMAAQVAAATVGGTALADDPVLRSRITSGDDEAWMPEVLVLSSAPDGSLNRVLNAMPAARRSALAVLVAGTCPQARLELHVRPDHTIEVPSLGLTLRANRLQDETATLVQALLDSARDLHDLPAEHIRPPSPNEEGGVDRDLTRIHRRDRCDGRVVKPECPSGAGESIFSRERFDLRRGASGRCECAMA